MNEFERLLFALGIFAFGLGYLMGRAHGQRAGRREVLVTLKQTVGTLAAARRARTSQDALDRPDGLRDLAGLSDAEKAAWDAREIP